MAMSVKGVVAGHRDQSAGTVQYMCHVQYFSQKRNRIRVSACECVDVDSNVRMVSAFRNFYVSDWHHILVTGTLGHVQVSSKPVFT